MLEIPESWDNCQRKEITSYGNRHMETDTQREMQSSQRSWKQLEILKKCLTSDLKMQNLEFDLLVFILILIQYFLIMLPFLYVRMLIYNLCHCILKICDLLFIFVLQAVIIKRQLHVSEKNLNFGRLNCFKTVISYGEIWIWTAYIFAL